MRGVGVTQRRAEELSVTLKTNRFEDDEAQRSDQAEFFKAERSGNSSNDRM